jgi:predicted aldo/keto reductase-like oxidoreductase
VQENVASAGRSGVGALAPEELRLIERVRDAYRSLSAAPCTACGYCMPCPNGVDIPRTFTALNSGVMFGLEDARRRYTHLLPDQSPEILASSCVQCRQCEEECPQGIPISAWMPYAHAVLGEGKPFDRSACPK